MFCEFVKKELALFLLMALILLFSILLIVFTRVHFNEATLWCMKAMDQILFAIVAFAKTSGGGGDDIGGRPA